MWHFGLIAAVLGVGILNPVTTASGQAQAQGGAASPVADDPQLLEPVDQLKSLEQSALKQARSQVRDLSEYEYTRLVRAVHGFAKQVAGDDDEKFMTLSARALDHALVADRNILGRFDATSDRPALAPAAEGVETKTPSILSIRELQKNARKLVELASQPQGGLAPVIPGQRVVGGRLAAASEFLDSVCVGSRSSAGDEYCCTGTLIGKNVVVTAGHCFPCTGASTVVFVGNNTGAAGKTYIGKAVQHPNYAQGGRHNDLTVLILNDDVEGVVPRRVATTAEIDAATFVRAVGFGNSDLNSTGGFGIKRLADIPIASVNCAGSQDHKKLGCDTKFELVAGIVGLKIDTCNGDSGGPVYVLVGTDPTKPESWAVAGATSRATKMAVLPCGDGGIYVRLDHYLDSFIKTVPGARF
jgi:hypothetical protein